MTKRILKKIYKNGQEYEVGNIKLYVITEDMVSVETDATKGVSPYNTSYGYTNITIDASSGIEWKEGAFYHFEVNTTMVVASAYRNVRVRIGTTGNWIPMKNRGNSILAGSSYMTKGRTQYFAYKTVYESGGALHLSVDTSYSAMSVAEGKTGTATSGRVVRADYLKQIIEYHAGNLDNELISGASYSDSWDGDTKAPTKNAVYDKITAMDTAIAGKLDNPSGGNVGDVLTKTANGEERQAPSGGGGGGASDHLEDKVPVGELYTLSDNVFIQATPTLENSTIDQEVGNVADNTQIHIQRIASGNASNELKLKIKKVGTPGDLTVQVMKGISVTVTTDVEAYWYGDSNNVLASGTVLASDITTSYQEITVSLGASVGGTKGDLLDIVLSQSSVNSSNYYVIACDSTQWSEGFSFVSVNGDTRTRSKLMPYCVSDGFADSILSKASSNGVQTLVKFGEIPSMGKAELYVPTGSWSRGKGQSIHISNPGTYIFDIPDISGWMVNYYGDVRDYSKVKMGIGYDYNTVVLDRGINGDMSAWRAEVNIATEGDYKILFYNGGAYNFQAYPPQRQAILVYQNGDIYKPTNYKGIKIYDEAGLGTEVSAYTLGRLPDNSRWNGGLGGGLPLEFVETFSVSSAENWCSSGKTYNYDIYVICKGDDDSTNFNVCSYYNGYTYPGGSGYASHFGIDSGFVKAGMTFGTVKIGGNQTRTRTYYIYKLSLPS